MHLLKVETEDGVYAHAVVRIDWPASFLARGGRAVSSLFGDYLHHSAALWTQMPAVSASIRIDVTPDGAVTTWHAVTAAPDDADHVRRFAAALFRLDGVDGAVVSAPGDAAQFQRDFVAGSRPGPATALNLAPRTTSAGGEIFNPVRILDRLNDLFASALSLGHSPSYQAVLRPFRPHPDLVRRVRKAEAFLAGSAGVPRPLLASQQLHCGRLSDAAYLAQEAVSIDAAGARWLERWLRDLAQHPEAGTPGWEEARIGALDEDVAAALEHHVHPDVLFGAASATLSEPDPAQSFWARADAGKAFRCEGLWRRDGAADDPAPVSPLPPPSAPVAPAAGGASAGGRGGEPFLFVSYAHRDIDRIRPILDGVVRTGVRIWIDDQIAVGEEWDTRLERMITTSSGLLVFLSPHYVSSKHCRRELKFADALDKEIFASALDAFPFEGGLGYIFASLQYASGGDDEIVHKLRARLGMHPSVGTLQ